MLGGHEPMTRPWVRLSGSARPGRGVGCAHRRGCRPGGGPDRPVGARLGGPQRRRPPRAAASAARCTDQVLPGPARGDAAVRALGAECRHGRGAQRHEPQRARQAPAHRPDPVGRRVRGPVLPGRAARGPRAATGSRRGDWMADSRRPRAGVRPAQPPRVAARPLPGLRRASSSPGQRGTACTRRTRGRPRRSPPMRTPPRSRMRSGRWSSMSGAASPRTMHRSTSM